MNLPLLGAVFDMDGLLIETERLGLETWRATRSAMGLEPDDALFIGIIGLGGPESRARIEAGLTGLVDVEAFVTGWRRRADAAHGRPIPLRPVVRETLTQLQAQGVPMVVATSTIEVEALRRLDETGLRPFFSDVICGDHVARRKPAPDIYLKAVAALGLPPERCAAFEDSPYGVRAAVAAGLVTIQVPDLVAPTPELLALGHRLAPDLAVAVRLAGLLPDSFATL